MLLHRVLAALVAVPIIIPMLIWGGSLINMIFFTIAAIIALSEYFGMTFKDDRSVRRFGIWLGAILFISWGLGIVYEGPAVVFHLSFVASFVIMFLFFLFRTGDMNTIAERVAKAMFGLIYVDALVIYLVAIHNLDHGWKYILLLLSIIWMNDTGAYFAGKSFGKRKFYEKVSPKKTWEGSVGGALAGLLAAYLFNWLFNINVPLVHVFLIAILTGYLGQLGDLCESLIKRSTDTKDSGSIIPGHGGVLDRIDALIFGAPLFYYYISLIVM